jgi:hypothetical protein
MSKHTPGPWRWELSAEHKSLQLVGGRPQYDLTIIEPTRWGMNRATMMIRDTAHDGMNIMHKLHERPDWIAPFPGRAHHASWCANVIHPDMLLIASAPDLLDALTALRERHQIDDPHHAQLCEFCKQADAAIAKATGAAA